jgi:hypothetical protein
METKIDLSALARDAAKHGEMEHGVMTETPDTPKPTKIGSQLMRDYRDVFDFIRKLKRGEDTLFQMVRLNAEHAVNKDVTKAAQNVLRALRKFEQRLRIFEDEIDHSEDIWPSNYEVVISNRSKDDDDDRRTCP